MDGSTYPGIDAFLADYKLGTTIGHGAFSKVKVAEHVLTGKKVAVKILDRLRMEEMRMVEKVIREIKILGLLTHPHITRLYEVIETSVGIYVVMEYAESGELFYYITENKLREDEARILFQQIISGLDYCHRNMVVHRDLKPENLLLDSKRNVKIADFGFSNIMRDGHFLRTSCGSPNYAAPEVVSGKLYAGPEVDVWSCGVILYALLCGKLPFDDENMSNLINKIKGGIYAMPNHLSPGARDLISRILVVEPMKRIIIPEICRHPWFQVRLPRYLALHSEDMINRAKKIDKEVLQEVVNLGFDRNQLIQSIYNRIQNKATVVYYLLLDNRYQVPNGPLNEASSSSIGYCILGPEDYQQASLKQFPVDKKWALGIQSRAHPLEIMTEVLKALQELNVRWKKIGAYNMKCKFFLGIPSAIIENGIVNRSSNTVKFEVQLYKAHDGRYLLDLQRAQGPLFLFLDLCAAILTQLQVF